MQGSTPRSMVNPLPPYKFRSMCLHLQDHPVSNVWTVAAPYILLYYIVSRFMWSQISSTMYFSLAPWDIWPFLWCALTSGCVRQGVDEGEI